MANPLFDELFGKHVGKETPFLELLNGEIITHAAFLEMSGRYANALTEAGISTGDRVVVQMEKSVHTLAIYAACVQAGFVFLPLNTAYTPAEVAYFLNDSEAGLLICDPHRAAGLAEIAVTANTILTTLGPDGEGDFAERSAGLSMTFETVARSPDDLAAFLYTSGTTGRSKGAMLTQGNLLSNAKALTQAWRFDHRDVLLHALPIFHTHGLFVAVNISLIAGGKILFLPKFDVDAIIERLPASTAMMGVPTFYTRLLANEQFTGDLVNHMRLFVSGSAPLLAETHVQFETKTGHRILERYGMTETNMNTSNPYDGERRAGTVGKPLPGVEVRITDANSANELPQGEIGDIEVRGPNVFNGYWRMPEKTAEELREDGFFITGDLGRLDEDGYLHIVGRNKDLIISGGYNIYPKEIELLLDQEAGVVESAVIGVPHPDFGETVVGVVVMKTDSEPDMSQILSNIAGSLARFKHPQKLVALQELPRNTMGKVQKKELRERFGTLFSI